ncbi:MAG TPA: hypothetical protein GX522_03240 [Firmicutes bacterium]|jgi:hypothetical protein|nr:hypothetical protein [Bacillota bacterium]
MKIKKWTIAIIFLIFMLSTISLATNINILAIEPIGFANKLYSGYYSKIAISKNYVLTFPLLYQEKENLNILETGVKYRNYLSHNHEGLYLETNGYFKLEDVPGPDDTLTITPGIVVGYRIDTQQGLYIEPEGHFVYPIYSNADGIHFSEAFESDFRVTIGLDNLWPNGFFLAPRVIFSYANDTLKTNGCLYIGFGF